MSRVCDACGYAINKPITWIIGLKIREASRTWQLIQVIKKHQPLRSPHKTKNMKNFDSVHHEGIATFVSSEIDQIIKKQFGSSTMEFHPNINQPFACCVFWNSNPKNFQFPLYLEAVVDRYLIYWLARV